MFSRLSFADPQLQDTAWTALVARDVTVDSTLGDQLEQRFNVQWRITTDPANANLRQIDVRVLWTEEDQAAGTPQRRYAVSSIRYND